MRRKPEHEPVVTTSELTATNAAERNALTHLAADARMLTQDTHPNLVAVVEARWLAANRLLISRTRVRGSTLRQTLDAVGPMQEPRVTEILHDVGGVLDWAARGNIVHRQVTSESVCFQKDSGRVMVSFALPAMAGETDGPRAGDSAFLLERCADGATLARLAYEMLTAHRAADASIDSLRAVRPDVSPDMMAAIGAGLACVTGAPPLGARQFLAMLPGGGAAVVGTSAIAAAAAAPVVPRNVPSAVTPPAPPAATPPSYVAPPAPVVAAVPAVPSAPRATPAIPLRPAPVAPHAAPAATPPRRRRGRGLMVAGMLALVLLLGSTFALIQRDRSGRDETRVAAAARDDEAAGDVDVVEPEPLPPDPGGLTTGQRPIQAPPPGTVPSSLPSSLPSNLPAPLPEELPPSRQPRADPEPVSPPPAAPPAAQPAVPSEGGCSSTAMADQRACLAGIIESSDAELTSVYQALLRAVGEREGDAAVERVRASQREWLTTRDRACRNPAAEDGTLWARQRGACFARQSDARALELARMLAAVRGD